MIGTSDAACAMRAVAVFACILALGACDDETGTDAGPDTDSGGVDSGDPIDSGVDAAVNTDAGPAEICSPVGGEAGFGPAQTLAQGYWYSRYNMLSLNLQSGNGVPFAPPAGAPAMMIAMASDGLSTAVMPDNPGLIQRVYDYGIPAFVNVNDGNPLNFANGRWADIPVADQATTTNNAWAWTLIKILEWDKQFHVDAHFGIVGDDDIPAAQQRFAGLVLFAEAMMMTMDWMNTPANYDMSDQGGQYVALMAMSDMAMVLTATALPHSTSNRYATLAGVLATAMGIDLDMMKSDMMAGMGTLFMSLTPAANIHDCAIAVQALTWFMQVAPDDPTRDAARALLVQNADRLIARPATTAADRAWTIRGATDAWRNTDDVRYLDAAVAAYRSLEADYDCAHGTFASQTTYTPEDAAGIIGALNATVNFLGDASPDVDRLRAFAVLAGFWEGTLDLGGLQIAAPPAMAPFVPAYEYQGDDLFHRHPAVPPPPAAGGANGTAPVLANSVTFDPVTEVWTADTSRFDTAGAMHFTNEALWFHIDEVDGFRAPAP